MKRPQPNEHAVFYANYVALVDDDVLEELETQVEEFTILVFSIPTSRADYAYAAGKWTIKEVLGHIIDTERVMAYRLTRFARNDSTPAPGFDEKNYVLNAHFGERTLESFVTEFQLLRKSNLFLYQSLNDEELGRAGAANGFNVTVRALLFIIAGHFKHHCQILTERYLEDK